MGAWGTGPKDTDAGLDFLASLSDAIVDRIDALLAAKPHQDAYVRATDLHELRAAGAFVVESHAAIGYASLEGQTQLQHCASRLATALDAAVRDEEAMAMWDDPAEVRQIVFNEIGKLRMIAREAKREVNS